MHLDDIPRREVKSVRERIQDIILRWQGGRIHHLLTVTTTEIAIAQDSIVFSRSPAHVAKLPELRTHLNQAGYVTNEEQARPLPPMHKIT